MSYIAIRNYRTGCVLYECEAADVMGALEQAVAAGACLDYADLRYASLVNAALDEAVLRHARFDGANLMGANMSEGCFDGASFINACFHGACLCGSSFSGCNFEGALFGATDIAGAVIEKCRFSTLSAFTLNFTDAARLGRCLYHCSDGAPCSFARAPVVVAGLRKPVIFMDDHVKIGNTVIAYDEWLPQGLQALLSGRLFMQDVAASFSIPKE